jgi:hypothetical protein
LGGGALSEALGIDERERAAIFTVQTAGEALNHHPRLHGLLVDGYWKDGVFSRFSEVDLKAVKEAVAERVLAQLHKRSLLLTLTWRRSSLRITQASA